MSKAVRIPIYAESTLSAVPFYKNLGFREETGQDLSMQLPGCTEAYKEVVLTFNFPPGPSDSPESYSTNRVWWPFSGPLH
jgi:hypothetical protein